MEGSYMADEKNDDLEKDLGQEEPEAEEADDVEAEEPEGEEPEEEADEDVEEEPEGDADDAEAAEDEAFEEDAEPESEEDDEEPGEDMAADESDQDEESDQEADESEEPSEDAEEEPEAADEAEHEEKPKAKGEAKDEVEHEKKPKKRDSADKKNAKSRPKKQDSKSKSKSKARTKGSKRSGKAGAKTFSLTAIIVCAIVCLLAGVLLDHYGLYGVLNGSGELADKTTVTEDELDTVMGTYIYDGTTYQITVRDVIESSSTLEASVNDDGTYDIPAADDALTYARNEILKKAVEDEGITVSDDEVDAYAEEYLGTSDYETIASNWGLDEDTAKETIKQSCAISKLRDEKVGTLDATLPDEPTAAAEGEEDVATAEYGAYIVNLLGDEWDSENETWARTDGPYYQALSGETFTSTSATYTQAEMAYYVAYSEYESAYSAQVTAWTDYVNGLLSNASIDLYTLGV
jgi:hypothetical protein